MTATRTARCTRKAFAGQTADRTVHKGDLTGIEIINRLMEKVLASGVEKLQEHRAVGLIPTKDGALTGWRSDDRHAHRAVPAGARQDRADGDGRRPDHVQVPHASWRQDDGRAGYGVAGRTVQLRDMEMVQFHPTGLLAGEHTRMTGTVLEEGLRGAGGQSDQPCWQAVHVRL